MKKSPIIWPMFFLSIIISIDFNPLLADDNFIQSRQFEPVVLMGGELYHFYDVPVEEIFLYAYADSNQSWRMIPFQIDERIRTYDPFHPGEEDAKRHSYFLPDNGVLDDDDEIVFLIRDLGDQAPIGIWINNEQAKQHKRLELKIYDPNNPNVCAYGYLFRSATIQEARPNTYGLKFHAEQDSVESNFYAAGLSKKNGIMEDIMIKPPFGNGVDIFDRQKVRFSGVMEYIFPVMINATENNFAAYSYERYTQEPIVRLTREFRVTLFDTTSWDMLAFYVTPKFYPFSATLTGGMTVSVEAIKDYFHIEDDIWVHFDLLRQSWDFNKNANGMKFYNAFNSEVPINGLPDQVNKTIEIKNDPELPPIREWLLTAGDQGSFFAYSSFVDTTWQSIELYYEDNNLINSEDTGDHKSYGDQGIIFINQPQDSVNLELGYTAYFLPANLSRSDAEQLVYNIENPIKCSLTAISFPTSVPNQNYADKLKSYQLFQNYPNPFNSLTDVNFYLPAKAKVKIAITDIAGRNVNILTDELFDQGLHRLSWDGTNSLRQQLPSGIYFIIFQSGDYADSKKLILLR